MAATSPFARLDGRDRAFAHNLAATALRRLGQIDALIATCLETPLAANARVTQDILRLGAGPHAVEIDLMQPLDPERSPKVHVPTLNHVGLWIDDLAACVDWLTEQGMRFTPGGIRKGAAGHDVCFIHPKGNEATPRSGEGVLIELVQAPPDVIAALGG